MKVLRYRVRDLDEKEKFRSCYGNARSWHWETVCTKAMIYNEMIFILNKNVNLTPYHISDIKLFIHSTYEPNLCLKSRHTHSYTDTYLHKHRYICTDTHESIIYEKIYSCYKKFILLQNFNARLFELIVYFWKEVIVSHKTFN